MLSLYDGEDMYNFSGLVNGKVVWDVFEEADKIKDGDNVKLVVTERRRATRAQYASHCR